MGIGATILGCEGPVLSASERAFMAGAAPWGFILFARNIETADQIRRLTHDLRDAVGREAPILIDQEGGRVQRLRPPLARDWLPPMDDITRAGGNAARAMWLRYRIIAAELRGLGIDANCAPIADIAGPATHPFLKNRCYGEDLAAVTRLARAVSDGLLAGGVLPVLKHIPGHGRATADSHLSLPVVDAPAAELAATDFAAFAALADLPMAMTAHIVFAAIDAEAATLSPAMIRLIRDRIGFGGLLMTDDISMQALQGDLRDLSARSIAAGCDVVLHCNGDMAEMEAVADGAGTLTGQAARRGEAALAARRAPERADLPALIAEYEALAAAVQVAGHG